MKGESYDNIYEYCTLKWSVDIVLMLSCIHTTLTFCIFRKCFKKQYNNFTSMSFCLWYIQYYFCTVICGKGAL